MGAIGCLKGILSCSRFLRRKAKELYFIMYTRLDEILGWLHRRLTEVKKAGAITAKETILLNNLV